MGFRGSGVQIPPLRRSKTKSHLTGNESGYHLPHPTRQAMFLSKRSNGVWYLWFDDELGRKQKVSTRCTLKSDALKFLQTYRQDEHERVSLSLITEDYLTYSRSVHTAKSQKRMSIALREFKRIVGDLPLHRIGVREMEQFLAVKKSEVSERTARTYFVTLASAFETARRWNCVSTNPFRLVEKPRVRAARDDASGRFWTDFSNSVIVE